MSSILTFDRLMKPVWIYIIIALLTSLAVLLLYYPGLNGPFVHDDINYVVGNSAIEITSLSWSELKKTASEAPITRRLLPNISFALNYYFLGSNPGGFRIINIIIHLGTAFTLFLLFRVTLQLPGLAGRFQSGKEIAFLSAFLWAVHPLQISSVTYIVQRMTCMATLFYSGSMLFYIYGRQATTFRRGLALYFISFICGVCALASKENSLTLPFALLALEFFFIRSSDLRKRYKTVLISLIAISALAAVVSMIYLNGEFNLLEGYQNRSFNLSQRLLTETRVVWFYTSLILLPLPSRINLLHDFPLSTGLFNPVQTAISILFIIIALGGVFYFYKRHKLISFAILWYFGNLFIESSFIPLEIVYEHRIYLPATFVIFTCTAYAYKLEKLQHMLPRIFLCLLVIIFAGFTWKRNVVWSSSQAFWQDVVNKSPNIARGYLGLHYAFKAQGKSDQALRVLEQAYAVNPFKRQVVENLVRMYFAERKYVAALNIVNEFIEHDPSRDALILRAITYGFLNDFEKVEKDAEAAIRLDPTHAYSFIILGEAQKRQGKTNRALNNLQKALSLGDRSASLFSSIGQIHLEKGSLTDAISYFKKALLASPNHTISHYRLSLAYDKKGMKEEAAKELKLWINLKNRPARSQSPHKF